MTRVLGGTVRPSGEAALVIEFADRIDPAVHDRVLAADRAVTAAAVPGVVACVPSYRSLLLLLDPLVTTPDEVRDALRTRGQPADEQGTTGRVHDVVVQFDGDDLDHVAEHAARSRDEVVQLLTSTTLRLYLHGFAPGFAYLGGVPPALHLPRRATPRAPVRPGAVLLAAGQAALCPVPMPTGWWVVGHTEQVLFDEQADPPVPFAPGDELRLVEESG